MYEERKVNCGKRIAEALSIRGMKQSELCRLTNIPKGSLSLYISGAYEPKADRIYLIAQVLRVSEAWLMGYDVPMTEDKKNNTPGKRELTESEETVLNLFRQLTEENQQVVLEWMKIATLKHK